MSPVPSGLKGSCWGLEPPESGRIPQGWAPRGAQGCGGADLMLWPLQLNEVNDQYNKLEERMEYIRSLHELTRSHFRLFSAENEALDISVRRQFRQSLIPPGPLPTTTLTQLLSACPTASGYVGGISV